MMQHSFFPLWILFLLTLKGSDSFSVSRSRLDTTKTRWSSAPGGPIYSHRQQCGASSRRRFNEKVIISSLVTSIAGIPRIASASGGATAGGAYLLSAKQRYNERVTKGAVGFLGIRSQLESGDIDAVRTFFSDESVGSWKDFSSAGYLLANAFRRNSSAAPDSLPSVKKWKAFAGDVENMTKSLKKKDTAGALVVYDSALGKLDEYLVNGVDLSAAKDLK